MLKTIKEQVRKVITYSQEIPEPQVDDLIDQWLEAKRDFIEAFGGKLIYELALPVTFELTQDARAERINNLIDYIISSDISDTSKTIDSFDYYMTSSTPDIQIISERDLPNLLLRLQSSSSTN